MFILVSGHSRGVGKTSLIEAILQAFPNGRFSTLKISAHRHGAADLLPLRPHQESSDGSTGRRLLAAGAKSSWLLRARDDVFPLALPAIDELLAGHSHWIVESNRLVRYRRPDLLLFVWRPEITDWKASSDHCLANCDAVVVRDSEAADRVSHDGPILFQPRAGILAQPSIKWLASRLNGVDARAGGSVYAADQSLMETGPCLA